MPKILTIVGTRPELIKMSRVIELLDRCSDHVLAHTGQNYDYELNQVFFDDLKIRKPDFFMNAAGQTAAATIANVIQKSDVLFDDVKPDAVLVYGDTNSCLCVLSAKRRRIPVFHFEAGNRCFDQRVPEELNRKVIDHLSDINFVLTEHARRYLLAEGITPQMIIKTGSHMPEVLDFHQKEIESSQILSQLGLTKKHYILVSAHREENVDDQSNLTKLISTLNQISEVFECDVVCSTHPRTAARLKDSPHLAVGPRVRLLKPFGFFDYVSLQKNSLCVVSDSGTITEESAILGFPAVTIRTAHERPEGSDSGVLIMSGLEPAYVCECVATAIRLADQGGGDDEIVVDYQSRQVSKKVVKAIFSYIPYIKENVWGTSHES